jgi:hypothetical protein
VALQGVDTQMKTNADAAIANTIVDAKGDIIAATAADTLSRLAVGANDSVLTADSTTATGLKWAAAAASGGMTLISTTTLTGATVTLSSIPQTYKTLQIVVRNFLPTTDNQELNLRINADANANRHFFTVTTFGSNATFNNTKWRISDSADNAVTQSLITVTIPDYANSSTWKLANWVSIVNNATTTTNANYQNAIGFYNQTGAISSLELLADSGNLTSGTVLLYGVS